MSLIDDLRDAAASVPPSHVPTQHELSGVLGALILHLEHGEAFHAAAADSMTAVGHVIEPPQDPPPDVQADQAVQIAELQSQLAVLQGAAGHPTIVVNEPEPGNGHTDSYRTGEPVEEVA